jgi:hypothetical protein
MKPEYKAEMQVNKKEIEMNPFVESFVAHVAIGMVESLKGVDYLNKVRIRQDGEETKVAVNCEELPLTPFPNDIIASTLKGMLAPLKGVDEIKNLEILVKVVKS